MLDIGHGQCCQSTLLVNLLDMSTNRLRARRCLMLREGISCDGLAEGGLLLFPLITSEIFPLDLPVRISPGFLAAPGRQRTPSGKNHFEQAQ